MKIDFRSDTVTQPTHNMREAMYKAEVGDDVYGDDPTVTRLEEVSAKLLGKEAALFVPSGTFGNQLAILTHTKRGDEVLLGDQCHIVMHEVGGAAVISGVQLRQVPTERGSMSVSILEKMIRQDDIHYPNTGLICIENAHSSGCVISIEEMSEVYELARRRGVLVHLDGARLFNASAHLGVSPSDMASYSDSIMFCLSKGLCAPVGSMLVGDRTFISKARKNRKLMGGGLRQSGFLAAAGIVALEEMVDRLIEDHYNAKKLAHELSTLSRVKVKNDRLDINMVFCEISGLKNDEALVNELSSRGFLINGPEDGEYRFVTNHGTSLHDVHEFVGTLKQLLEVL